MRRLTLFAKGNNDVRDSLHSMRVGGELRWNGINDLVRTRHPDALLRVRHEVCTRSDALLAARGEVPPDLAIRPLPLAPYTAASQFSAALYAGDVDAIVLSIQADVMNRLLRHAREGYLLYPNNWNEWTAPDKARLADEFVPEPMLDAETSARNFEAIVARIRERSQAPILVYNVSAIVPGDRVHCYQGLDEILSTRIRRFNLALTELSAATGISVIDVDAILAREGASRLKYDVVHTTPEAQPLIAAEVLRVLDDLECFSDV